MSEKYELSRRKALAALGTIGVAGAGAGLGTSAYFSDQETFTNNQLVAGELDLKAAATHHYVDWLKDTAGGPGGDQEVDDASMADTDEEADLVLNPGDQPGAMPIRLEIGDAGGLANGSVVSDVNGGVPIGAYGDGEEETYPENSLCNIEAGGDDDDASQLIIDLDDVKPGDFGIVRFAVASCDNPAFAWLRADILDADENGNTEPEAEDPDEYGPEEGPQGNLLDNEGDEADDPGSRDPNETTQERVELLDAVQLAVLDGDAADALISNAVDSDQNGNDPTLELDPELSLRGLAETDEPVAGDIPAEDGGGVSEARNCFEGITNHRFTLVWWLPIDHGNEVQGDSATFELGVYAEQCRHNDGSGMPPETDTNGT